MLSLRVVSVLSGGGGPNVIHRRPSVIYCTMYNWHNLFSPREAYNMLLRQAEEDVIVFIHDDLDILEEDWEAHLVNLFQYPNTVAVGFGGASGLGHPNLYKEPYRIQNMARSGYCSNQVDAETHGKRFGGCKRVAVLDAFCMAIRTKWLKAVGGWPRELTHHCLDLWLACEAARQGKDIWMAGVSCHHHGGGTSVKDSYKNASWLQGGTLESDHSIPHRWLYEEYRDVLPITVR